MVGFFPSWFEVDLDLHHHHMRMASLLASQSTPVVVWDLRG